VDSENEIVAQECKRVVKLMIVESFREVAETLGYFFQKSGFEVVIESNPFSALHHAESGNFDAFLIDTGLEGMSGYELARRLRNLSSAKAARLIGMTVFQGNSRPICTPTSFDMFLTKPLDALRIFRFLRPE
jgi:DNA-binding response OmpR family regulator